MFGFLVFVILAILCKLNISMQYRAIKRRALLFFNQVQWVHKLQSVTSENRFDLSYAWHLKSIIAVNSAWLLLPGLGTA